MLRKFAPKKSLALGAVLLGVGVLTTSFEALNQPREGLFKGEVLNLFPTLEEVDGWILNEESIAASEEMRRTVSEMLNYTDARFISYKKNDQRVSVYIAYWSPGRMSHRLIAGHTPDTCWVKNGWILLNRKSSSDLSIAGAGVLKRAELRELSLDNNREWVAFWHLVGNKTQDYTEAQPPWHAMFSDIMLHGSNLKSEQFFIRISSNRSDHGLSSKVAEVLIKKLISRGVPIVVGQLTEPK
jgi:hypothetical protein